VTIWRERDPKPGRERFYRRQITGYDERGDVLYLSVGEPRIPSETDATPEVLVNVRYLLDRDGELKITWPEGHIRPEQLAPALAPAARVVESARE
jgi:hypothetical protein